MDTGVGRGVTTGAVGVAGQDLFFVRFSFSVAICCFVRRFLGAGFLFVSGKIGSIISSSSLCVGDFATGVAEARGRGRPDGVDLKQGVIFIYHNLIFHQTAKQKLLLYSGDLNNELLNNGNIYIAEF